ncbi:MAG: lysophospholipase [Planctomycetaceae bacterium]
MSSRPAENAAQTATSPIEETVVTPDGVSLWVQRFAGNPPTQGTILFTHGACEHSGRYREIFASLQQSGWNMIAWDLRGHGRSGGVRTNIRKFDEYLDDLDVLWKHYQLDPMRTALMGHSMGGLVVIRYVQTRKLKCLGLILASPLLKLAIPIPGWLLAIGKRLRWIAPRWRFHSRVQQKDTTRDPAQLALRRQDTFIQRKVTVNWFYAVQEGIQQAWRDAGQLHSPALILQAADDRIVSADATSSWAQLAASSEVTYISLADHYHELFHEADRFETLGKCVEWLKGRLGTAQ